MRTPNEPTRLPEMSDRAAQACIAGVRAGRLVVWMQTLQWPPDDVPPHPMDWGISCVELLANFQVVMKTCLPYQLRTEANHNDLREFLDWSFPLAPCQVCKPGAGVFCSGRSGFVQPRLHPTL